LDWEAIWLSVRLASLTTLILFLVGLPFATGSHRRGSATSRKDWRVHLFHLICCFLITRFGKISLTALSTKAGGSPAGPKMTKSMREIFDSLAECGDRGAGANATLASARLPGPARGLEHDAERREAKYFKPR
jgi:hypothetical protein